MAIYSELIPDQKPHTEDTSEVSARLERFLVQESSVLQLRANDAAVDEMIAKMLHFELQKPPIVPQE